MVKYPRPAGLACTTSNLTSIYFWKFPGLERCNHPKTETYWGRGSTPDPRKSTGGGQGELPLPTQSFRVPAPHCGGPSAARPDVPLPRPQTRDLTHSPDRRGGRQPPSVAPKEAATFSCPNSHPAPSRSEQHRSRVPLPSASFKLRLPRARRQYPGLCWRSTG